MGDAAVSLRYETFWRPEATRWPEFAARQRARINSSLDEMEASWRDTLLDVNLGSIAAAVVIGYLDIRHPTIEWRKNHANLEQWHDQFIKRDSMINTVPKT